MLTIVILLANLCASRRERQNWSGKNDYSTENKSYISSSNDDGFDYDRRDRRNKDYDREDDVKSQSNLEKVKFIQKNKKEKQIETCTPLQAVTAYKLQEIVKMNLPAIENTFSISNESCISWGTDSKDLKNYKFNISFMSKDSDTTENAHFTVFARVLSMSPYGNYDDPSQLEIRLSFLENPKKIKQRILGNYKNSFVDKGSKKKKKSKKSKKDEKDDESEQDDDENENQTTENKIEDKQKKLTIFEKEKNKMELEKNHKESEIALLKGKLNSGNQKIKQKLDKELNDIEKELKDLEKEIKLNRVEIEILNDDITELEEKLIKELKLSKKTKDKMTKLETNVLEKQIIAIDKQKLEKQIAVLDKKKSDLKNEENDNIKLQADFINIQLGQAKEEAIGFLDVQGIKKNIIKMPTLLPIIQPLPRLKGNYYDCSLDISDFGNVPERKYIILVAGLNYFSEISLINPENILQYRATFFEFYSSSDKTEDLDKLNFKKNTFNDPINSIEYLALKKPDYYEETKEFPMGYKINKTIIVSKIKYHNDSKDDADLKNLGLEKMPTFSFTIANILHDKDKFKITSAMKLFAPITDISYHSDVKYNMYLGMQFDCEFRSEIFNINYFLIYVNSQTTPNNLMKTRTSQSSIFEFWVDIVQNEQKNWINIRTSKNTENIQNMPHPELGGISSGFAFEQILRNFMTHYITNFSNPIEMNVIQKDNTKSKIDLDLKFSDFMEIYFLDAKKKWISFDLLNFIKPQNYFDEFKTVHFIKFYLNSKAITEKIKKSTVAGETRKLTEKSEEEGQVINDAINNIICKIEFHFEIKTNSVLYKPEMVPKQFLSNTSGRMKLSKHTLMKVACKNIRKVYNKKSREVYLKNEMDVIKDYYNISNPFKADNTFGDAVEKRRVLI